MSKFLHNLIFGRRHNFDASIAFRHNKTSMIKYCDGYNTYYSRKLAKWIHEQPDDPYLYNKVARRINKSLASKIWKHINDR